ncbi:hypothetical protein [Parasphingorhabdus sp.]|uniref:hypothetical protein n=1 Tax=Parasphingorhabdus sp. TaxID=2709688 RepID=UPI003D27677D
MFKLALSLIYWFLVRRNYFRGSYKAAIKYFGKLKDVFEVKFRHRAFYATLLMLDGQGKEALELFQRVANEIDQYENDEKTDNLIYIQAYCLMYASGLKGLSDGNGFFKIAKKSGADKSIRNCLPLPTT